MIWDVVRLTLVFWFEFLALVGNVALPCSHSHAVCKARYTVNAGRRVAGHKVTSLPRANDASRSQDANAEDEQCSSFVSATAALTNENASQQRFEIKLSNKEKKAFVALMIYVKLYFIFSSI